MNMNEIAHPLVTIVTPSYNQGRFIGETIASILSQDYSPLEYMVMDGGSTDATLKILKSYGNRFFWISEKDKGQAHAINKGWRRARGTYLAWLNSDDIYLPGAVSKALTFLEKNPDKAAVYGEGYHIEEDGRIIERYPTEPFDRKRLIETCFICQPTVFIRRAALEKIGFLDETLQYCMDYELWLRMAKKFEFGYLPDYLACTRFYASTKTLGQKRKVHGEILSVVYRHHKSLPPTWVYGYAHAFWEGFLDREKPFQNGLFILGLIGMAMALFLYYNHQVPFSEFRRWWKWVCPRVKRKGFKPARSGRNLF